MDDRRELDDILIGGDDNRAKRNKSLLLLIAGIIVLVIAIAAIALNMSSSKPEEEIVIDTQDTNLENSQFNNVPIDSAEEDKFARIVQEIKSKQQNTETPSSPFPSSPQPSVDDTPKATMPDRKTQVATAPKPKVTTTRPANVFRGNNGDIAESGFYLQVGAFGNKPNQEFLNKIDKYSYRIQEIMINSKVITRYLVGPYASRSAAQKDYDNIARDIARPVYLEIK